MEDLPGILDEPLLADLILEADAPSAIDWSFADAIGAAILALADELKRSRLTRAEARIWLKVTDHSGGVFFEIVWSQAVRISGVSPSKGGRPLGSRNQVRNGHVRVSASAQAIAVRQG